MPEWLASYWWVIVGGIPALGIGGWLLGKVFGGKKRIPGGGALGPGLVTVDDVDRAREKLEKDDAKREKELEADRRAALAEWDEFVQRRKAEATAQD